MPVISSLSALDREKEALIALGYDWRGPLGIEGRRQGTRNNHKDGTRLFHIHCFENQNPEIQHHLAFRDYLRIHSQPARDYEAEKQRCAEKHPQNSHAYSDCKAAWIQKTLFQALINTEK